MSWRRSCKGGAEKIHEADCALLGGHSVKDNEVKFGYAVTGLIHPDRIKTNAGARPGDALVFTKRLGTGVISTALKQGIAKESDVEAAIQSMLKLNREACEAMLAFEVHGCTDVTGFGLIGHAREMALASKVTIEIDPRAVQFLPGAVDYARQGAIPGGLKNNREFASSCVEGNSEFDDLLVRSADFGRPADRAAGTRCGGARKETARRLSNRAGDGESGASRSGCSSSLTIAAGTSRFCRAL